MSRASEQAYAKIRAHLLSGAVRPNEQLTEDQLSQITGVSRTPVREAVRRLEKGLSLDVKLFQAYRVLAFVVGVLLAFCSFVALPLRYLPAQGSSLQQLGETLKRDTGIKMDHVPFRGAAPLALRRQGGNDERRDGRSDDGDGMDPPRKRGTPVMTPSKSM